MVSYQSPARPLLGLATNSFALGNPSPENISGIAVPSSFSASRARYVVRVGIWLRIVGRMADKKSFTSGAL
jgi:hypothetical protein